MSDFKKIREYKKKRQPKPEMSEAEFKFHCERATDLIMSVYERLPKDAPPVKESFGQLLDEMNDLTRRRETIVNSDGRRIRVDETGNISVIQKSIFDEKKATKNNSGGSEVSSINTQTFTEDELKILENLQNGRSN